MPGDEAPRTRKEARLSNFWPQWDEAEQVELGVHEKNGTWRLVHKSKMPPKTRLIRTRWVYALKLKPDDTKTMVIDKFKARLVAMGFSQIKGVDYMETFASVMRTKTFRMLLALWVQDPSHTSEQWDVQAAFIQAPFADGEELYMAQPEGHEIEGMEDYVCRLDKAIYGTKQAANAWQKHLRSILLKAGYTPLIKDDAVYQAHFPDGGWCFVGTHVDDMFVFANIKGQKLRDKLWAIISKSVPITNLGTTRWALKTLIEYDPGGGVLKISQESYAIEILKRFGFIDAKPAPTPAGDQGNESTMLPEDLAENADHKDREQFLKEWPIYEAIGCLWWIATISRVDIMTALHTASQFVCKPSKKLWRWISRIFRYIKGSTHLGLVYRRKALEEVKKGWGTVVTTPTHRIGVYLTGAADSSFADAPKAKSTLGQVWCFNGCVIGVNTKKSTRVLQSSTEAEINALTMFGRENRWLRDMLRDMRVFDLLGATRVEEDNSAAVTMSMVAGATKRSRFYHIDLWWMKEQIDLKELEVVKVDTSENVADLFTKQLPVKKFTYLRNKIMGDANDQQHFTPTTTVGKVNVAHLQESQVRGMSKKRSGTCEDFNATSGGSAKRPKPMED